MVCCAAIPGLPSSNSAPLQENQKSTSIILRLSLSTKHPCGYEYLGLISSQTVRKKQIVYNHISRATPGVKVNLTSKDLEDANSASVLAKLLFDSDNGHDSLHHAPEKNSSYSGGSRIRSSKSVRLRQASSKSHTRESDGDFNGTPHESGSINILRSHK